MLLLANILTRTGQEQDTRSPSSIKFGNLKIISRVNHFKLLIIKYWNYTSIYIYYTL